MRVSTSMMYELGSGAITRQNAELVRTQQQLSSAKRLLSAADDTVAAAAVLFGKLPAGVGGKVGITISGGNVDWDLLRSF